MPNGDHELLQQWRNGDANSGNALFRRHFRSVRRFFRNKVPQSDVEDLIQRTFTSCVEGRDRFREDASFRTFLFAVARRQLLKFLRDRASYDRHIEFDQSVSSVHGLGLTPSAMMAKQQDQDLLLQALQRLSVEHQTVLEFFYWEQLSGQEIAEILGISPATVRTRLHRGRQALEKALGEVIGGPAKPGPEAELEDALRRLGSHL